MDRKPMLVTIAAGVLALSHAGASFAQGTAAPKKPAAAAPKKAAPPATKSVEAEIEQMEKDRAAAAVKADVAKMDKMTADDYTFINRLGQMSDKARTLSGLKAGDIKLTANDVSDLKVRLYGNTAVVTGRADVKGTLNGKDITGGVLFTRVLVKKDGRWQSVALQQTPIQP